MAIIKIEGSEPSHKSDQRLQTSFDQGIQNVEQSTELKQTLEELNNDSIQEDTRMSGIDLRSRLQRIELNFVFAYDGLTALGVIPEDCLIVTRQKKRLSVSLDGKGRDDIKDISVGKQENDIKKGPGGFVDGMKNLVGAGKK